MKEQMPEILAYIRDASQQKSITSEVIAKHFNYDKYYFSRKFKEINGFSVAEYLSSLKVEKALFFMEQEKKVIDLQIQSGYESSGTFSNTFKKYTGTSPKKYQNEMNDLYDKVKEIEGSPLDSMAYGLSDSGSHCYVSFELPASHQNGLIFLGLFRTLIPNHKPIVGMVTKNLSLNLLNNIPQGDYYLLACAISSTGNIWSYFNLSKSLRGKVDQKLSFPAESTNHYTIHLREAIPEDPPILINLPRLLISSIKETI